MEILKQAHLIGPETPPPPPPLQPATASRSHSQCHSQPLTPTTVTVNEGSKESNETDMLTSFLHYEYQQDKYSLELG
ncbi:hypothetical protein E2C01_035882 [Portunus trituberculatus]|uniref:Uncharacterized protein n=1 Tax=Portunus trituberculatus TaxID=210409 RepID=A0A5B7FAX3_PORTR|nr:hypothetical protein [Portunus trituberculatus]